MPRIGVEAIDVVRVAEQLRKNGQTVTVASVRAVLGTGSQSTIVRHLSAWRAEAKSRGTTVSQVSPNLMNALLRELSAAAVAATSALKIEAEVREADIAELGRALATLEADLDEIRGQLSAAIESREQLRGRLDAQLEHSKQCEARTEELRNQIAVAERRAAVAEAQAAAQAEMAKDARQRLAEIENDLHQERLTPRRPKKS